LGKAAQAEIDAEYSVDRMVQRYATIYRSA